MNDAPHDPSAPEPPDAARRRLGRDWRNIPKVDVIALAVVAIALGYAYWPNFADLYRTWDRDPDYSHGYLVLPIALVILYRLWPKTETDQPRFWLPGLIVVVASLALRLWLHERGSTWSETATLLPVIVGLGLSRLGPRTMLRVWPAFAFLVFWFPLPTSVNAALSQPLQSTATWASCKVLRATGLWVMPEGNVIMVGGEKLEVAAACNGLSMLMSLAATVVATASLWPMTVLKRVALLLTIIPIALASNILRISATAWCYYHFGAEIGSKYAHDAAGWLMMPTAMAFVGLELVLLSWLVVESPVSETAADPFAVGFGGTRRPSPSIEVRR